MGAREGGVERVDSIKLAESRLWMRMAHWYLLGGESANKRKYADRQGR